MLKYRESQVIEYWKWIYQQQKSIIYNLYGFFRFMKTFVLVNSLKELDNPNQTLLLAHTYTSVFGFAY